MFRVTLALLAVLLLAGCMSGGGQELAPVDYTHNPSPPPSDQHSPQPPDGGGTPGGDPDPVDPTGPKIGVMLGHYVVDESDAARIANLAVLTKTNAVLSIKTLLRTDYTGTFEFDGLPLNQELHVGVVEFDSQWGASPDVLGESAPITLTLDHLTASDLQVKASKYEDLQDYQPIHYRLFPQSTVLPPLGVVCAAYRIVDDPRHRVWITFTSFGMLSQYANDGSPFDFNNDGLSPEILYAPKDKTVIFGWYEIPGTLDMHAGLWTIDQLLPIVEFGPVQTNDIAQVYDLTFDLDNRGEPVKTH